MPALQPWRASSPSGRKPLPCYGSALSKRFRRAQREAGLRIRRFHDLRHTFGSIAVRRLDLVKVQTLLGHASLTTTERYLHSQPRTDDAARLAEAFESTNG